MEKRVATILALAGLLIALTGQSAYAFGSRKIVARYCPYASGNCAWLRGIAASMDVYTLTSQDCPGGHVSSIYVRDPFGTSNDYFVEMGWHQERDPFCDTKDPELFIARNKAGSQSVLWTLKLNPTTQMGEYRFLIYQSGANPGEFLFRYDDPSGTRHTPVNGSGQEVKYDAWADASWEKGPTDVQGEINVCGNVTVDDGLNTWVMSNTYVWKAANTTNSVPLAYNYDDGCAGASYSRTGHTGSAGDDVFFYSS